MHLHMLFFLIDDLHALLPGLLLELPLERGVVVVLDVIISAAW